MKKAEKQEFSLDYNRMVLHMELNVVKKTEALNYFSLYMQKVSSFGQHSSANG